MDRLKPGSYVRPCNKNNIYLSDEVQCISNGYSGEEITSYHSFFDFSSFPDLQVQSWKFQLSNEQNNFWLWGELTIKHFVIIKYDLI